MKSFHRHSRWLYIQQQSASSSSNCFIEHEFPGRNVVFNKTIAGRRRTLLLKMKSLASPVFNLKALEFGAIFACFHLFRYLKVVQLTQNCAETFRVQQALKQKKNRLKIALQVSKLASSPIVMP